jgi:hypothetical protein
MRVLGYLTSGVAALVGVVGALLILGLINGGLVYRKQCATVEGTVKTDWTYRWFAPIPYLLAPSESGCDVHNGTRVALSSIGIWDLKQPTASDLQRNYAKSSRTDPGLAYISEVIAVINDLKQATREHVNLKTAFVVMRKGKADLHALTPPDYLRADHARMLVAYDRSVDEAQRYLDLLRAGDQAAAQRHAKASVAATTQFALIAQRMQQTVVAKQAGP